MKIAKAGKVPVLENAFEVNLPKLMRSAKKLGTNRLVLDDGDIRTVVQLTETRLAIKLGGKIWLADIASVSCLGGRLRPLLKCPRAHEGNFQSLYFRTGELACRKCHELRYTTKLATTQQKRKHLAKIKLLAKMGHGPGEMCPTRLRGRWRGPYGKALAQLAKMTSNLRAVLAQTT